MAGKIIMWLVCFGCGFLFFGIGVYARRTEKPMWFWSGVEVTASQIRDVGQYNKENALLWQTYALWYFAAGVAEIWDTLIAAAILVLSCTVGIALLIRSYNRIYKKYQVQ